MMEYGGGHLTLTYESSYGRMSERLAASEKSAGKVAVNVVPETLQDFVRLLPVGDVCISFCKPRKSYFIILEGLNSNLGYMTTQMRDKEAEQ